MSIIELKYVIVIFYWNVNVLDKKLMTNEKCFVVFLEVDEYLVLK